MPGMQLLSATIELAANQALSWSSNRDSVLRPLNNKTCIIYIQEIEQAFIFKFNQHDISVFNDPDRIYSSMPAELEDNECWVSLSLFVLDKLKQNSQLTQLIKAGQLDFSGDLTILQSVSKVFSVIELDLEEVLSKYVGDVAAYQIGSSGKKAWSFASKNFSMLVQTLSEAALDEKEIAVRKIMVSNFSDEVAQLRSDAERLEARIRRLEESSHSKESN